MNSASMMEMWINGIKVTSGSDTTQYRTENKAKDLKKIERLSVRTLK